MRDTTTTRSSDSDRAGGQASPDAGPVADLRGRGARIRVRSLRSAGAAARAAPGPGLAGTARARRAGVRPLGEPAVLRPRADRRRLSACSAAISPTASAGGGSSSGASALRVVRRRRRPRDDAARTAGVALRDDCRRGGRVHRRRRLAGGAVPHPKQRQSVLGYTQAAVALGGVMATGAYYVGGDLRGAPAGHPHGPRRVALHAALRPGAGDPARAAASLPAGIAGVAGAARPRDLEAAERGGAVLAGLAGRDAGHDAALCVCVCDPVRGPAADTEDGSGPSGGARADAARARADGRSGAVPRRARQPGGAHAVRLARGPDRLAAAPLAPFPRARADRLRVRLLLRRDAQPACCCRAASSSPRSA